jgi:hypothetical protein
MHDAFRRRLEVLEEAHRLANGPVQIVNINFVCSDGTPVVPTVARGRNFECFRRDGEEETLFRARANAEARALANGLVQILIFGNRQEISHAP